MLKINTVSLDGYVCNLFSILDKLEVAEAFTERPVLVHYDLWPGNIFYCANSRTVTVIDLERCIYADHCAEGASLLGMMDAVALEHRLCAGHPARIAKMYVYRILFLAERLTNCVGEKEYRDILKQINIAKDILTEKMRILERD